MRGRLRLLIDLDGVLFRGADPLPGVSEFFDWVGEQGHSYALVTNNSTRTPRELSWKLAGYGLTIDPARIVTSATAAAEWLKLQAPDGARVQVFGGPGLMEALFSPGSRFTPDWHSPEWLVAGTDLDVTYARLTAACRAIERGARFVATNPDTTLPTEHGLSPGAGALHAVITAVTGVKPVVIGKPEPGLFQMALKLIGGEGDILVIGDRLDTDILAGERLGAKTALVLTGVSGRADVDASPVKPDYVFENLTDLRMRWMNIADRARE